jgi:hypothetical protein
MIRLKPRLPTLARLALQLGLWAATAHVANAQAPVLALPASEPNLAEKDGKVLHAYRVTGTPPVVDGQLDDEVWSLAEQISDFVQIEPDNGDPSSERTVVQIAYDNRYLYVAARCYMKDPSRIVPGRGRRDNLPPSDNISISLDPQHDHLTAYVFLANASGGQNDLAWFDDTQANGDYDAVWSAETTITSEGWNVEFRIPFSQMRFTVPAIGPVVWGLQLRRDITRRGEYARWVGTPRGVQGFVSRFGHLIFDTPMAPHGAPNCCRSRSAGSRRRHVPQRATRPEASISASESAPRPRWRPPSTPTSARSNRIQRC